MGIEKTGEARLAGQAAIEGLSAPMRLPSAISHTPKLSVCFILYFNLQTKRIGKANRATFGNAKNVAQLLASPIQRECAS